MKKTLIALATLSALSNIALAQSSNVTVYGVLDEALRYSNHVDAARHSQVQLVQGMQQGSRLGFEGSEDMGSGTKAIFGLEAGFSVGTGFSSQGGRLFGRNATVGLSNSQYGTLTLGRQNTLAYDFDIVTDVYGFSGYQGSIGLRFDNSIKYVNAYGPVSVGAEYSFGNQTGAQSKNAAYSLSTGYNNGPLDLRAVYQKTNDTKDGVAGTLAGQQQKFYALGGSYDFSGAKVFAQYFNNRFDVSNQKNDIYVVAASYNLTPAVITKVSYAYDKQRNVSQGNRSTISALLGYNLSKRTDIYTEVDYNRFNGNYNNLFDNLNNAGNPNTTATGLYVGIRHMF